MLSLLITVACTKTDGVTPDSGLSEDTGDSAAPSYPSSYETGKYRADSLVIVEDQEAGGDVDNDGEAENKLPVVLMLVDVATAEPTAAEDINATLVEDLGDGTIVVLGEMTHADGTLLQDILLGTLDEETEALGVDPVSYGDDGVPVSRLTGGFSTEVSYTVKADSMVLPFPIVADQPPVLVPLEMVTVDGTVDAEQLNGMMYGAVPVDGMIDDVVDAIVPTGDDYDPAAYQDMERDEFLEYLRDFANDENVSDIDLGDGRRGVSAALTFTAVPADW